MSDDYTQDTSTTGSVAVGGTAAGEIETGDDFDWFAVDLVAGSTYVIDLERADSGGGTLDSTVLRGLYNSDGLRIADTQTNDGGEGDDARLTFTATESGTHYIAARGYGDATGTYTVRVSESVSDDTRDEATDLGDIADLDGPRFPDASLDGTGDRIDYFRFTLTEAKAVGLGLRQQDADADLFLEDAEGTVLHSSTVDGTANEWIEETLLAGTYYVRVEAREEGGNDFKLRYGVGAPDADAVARLEQQQGGTNAAPAFAETSYAFDLPENADGSTNRVALGTVSATDADSDALTYGIEGGDAASLFEIDSSTGALSYRGPGEDYESETTGYALTEAKEVGLGLREQDADADLFLEDAEGQVLDRSTVDGAANEWIERTLLAGTYYVRVEAQEEDNNQFKLRYGVGAPDADEVARLERHQGSTNQAPAFDPQSYTFSLAEHADGGTNRVALGTVSATDTQSDTLTYSIEGGNEADLFEIDAATGALSYKGAGENYESETTSYVLTVRASDGHLHSDVTVTVNVSDIDERSEPSRYDFAADTSTPGQVMVGGSATGTIGTPDDRDWFAVTFEAGRTYRIDLKPGFGTAAVLWDPYLRGVYDADGNWIAGTSNNDRAWRWDSRVFFEPETAGTYYIAAGASRGETGLYDLSVTDVGEDDYSADTDTAGTVAVDGSAAGEIETPDDRDWFEVTLEAGRRYRIDLEGFGTDRGTLLDPRLHGVYDGDGALTGERSPLSYLVKPLTDYFGRSMGEE